MLVWLAYQLAVDMVVSGRAPSSRLDLEGYARCVITRSFLCRYGIMVVSDFPWSGIAERSLDHIILHYSLSKKVWVRAGAELNLHFIWPVWKEWLSSLSGGDSGSSILRKFIQSVLMYTNWKTWKGNNILLFESDHFKSKKAVHAVIYCDYGNLVVK